MRLVYVIGEPGVGKSTLVRRTLEPLTATPERKPFAHVHYYRESELVLTQLGAEDPMFPGTDRLSMGVLPAAIEFVNTSHSPLILAEGDRLATRKFLDAVEREVLLVRCVAPQSVIEARRAARGSDQSPSWLAGRRTKINRLWDGWTGPRLRISTNGSEAVSTALLRSALEFH